MEVASFRIPIKRVSINVGINPQGQILQQHHVADATKKIWIVPGKYLVVELTKSNGTVTVAETPFGPFGWEYDPI